MAKTPNPWNCLEMLLNDGQFELINFEKIRNAREPVDGKVIYLMNDTVESFLVFRNARYTGTYLENYEDEISYSLDKTVCFLKINQGDSHLLLFFDSLEIETHYYNYGGIGHFWVNGYENLRNLEFQLAIIRDKYDFLGPSSCNELEQKLSALRNFPPLNYLFYPAISDRYITPLDNPWALSKDALDFFACICADAGDQKLLRITRAYGKHPGRRLAKKLARLLRQTRHKAVPDRIYALLCEAASAYPKRSFGQKLDEKNAELLKKADHIADALAGPHCSVRIYHEEPFVYDCDDITFKVYIMILQDRFYERRVTVREI